MKKLLFLSAIVFMVGLFALSPLSASAHEVSGKSVAQSTQHGVVPAVSCTDDGCDGLSPVSTGCSSGAVVERTSSFTADGGGVVELVFNYSCHAAWGFIQFNNAMPSGHTGDAEIYRNTDGTAFFCEDSGGNGVVEPGQHSCYTPMVGDGPSESAFALGWYDAGIVANTSSF